MPKPPPTFIFPTADIFHGGIWRDVHRRDPTLVPLDLVETCLDPILKLIRREGLRHLTSGDSKQEIVSLAEKTAHELDRFPEEVAAPVRAVYGQIYQAFFDYAANVLTDVGEQHPRLVVSGISGYDVILTALPEAAPVTVILAP